MQYSNILHCHGKSRLSKMKCGWFNRYSSQRINNHGLGQTFCNIVMHLPHTLLQLMRAEMVFIRHLYNDANASCREKETKETAKNTVTNTHTHIHRHLCCCDFSFIQRVPFYACSLECLHFNNNKKTRYSHWLQKTQLLMLYNGNVHTAQDAKAFV